MSCRNKGTICYLIRDNQVLLARIKYPNGAEYWNGLGGVIEESENHQDAAIRELEEEITISATELENAGEVKIGELTLYMYIVKNWQGEPQSNEDSLLELKWFQKENIPYAGMRPGNEEWLKPVLDNFV